MSIFDQVCSVMASDFVEGPTVNPQYQPPQPAQKPLTDKQREEIAKGWRGRNWTVGDIIDAIEAAHGIKENT